MKRVNVYINEEDNHNIDLLSNVMRRGKSEIMRSAMSEYLEKHINKLDDFVGDDLIDSLEVNDNDTQLTKQFMDNCRNTEFFIENCVKILHVDRGIIDFDLYKAQRQLLYKFENYKRIVINSSRICGLSVLSTAFALHHLLFNPNSTHIFINKTIAIGQDELSRMRIMIEHLPDYYKSQVTRITKDKIIFVNGSVCYVATPSIELTHFSSKKIYLHIAEFSYMSRSMADKLISEFYNFKLNAQLDYKIIISSTPSTANHFYKLWSDSISNYNGFHAIKLPWTLFNDDNSRDESWKNKMIDMIGKDKFDSEFNNKFQLSEKGDLYNI